jgi:hypothetical protein
MVEIVIFNGQGPPKGDFNIFNWLLMVLWGVWALQSSTEALLISLMTFFPSFLHWLRKCTEICLCKWLLNKQFLI